MKSLSCIRLLYAVASVYDVLLGLAFIVAGPAIFAAAHIEPPNHWGYLHFSAGVLLVFGAMFYQIARNPVAHRELVLYGILFKACYVATVAWYWTHGDVPGIWKIFAGADLVFAVLFVWSLARIPAADARQGASGPAAHAA